MVLVSYRPINQIVLVGLLVMVTHFLHAGSTCATLPGTEESMTTTIEFIRYCSKVTGVIQPGPDGVRRGFVAGLQLELHATYPAPRGHESALVCARGRPAFASCDSAGCPVPRHSRRQAAACRREMPGPFLTWVQRAS